MEDELGVGIDDIRLFIALLESIGIKQNALVLCVPRSVLVSQTGGEDALTPEKVKTLLAALTLPRRPNWHTVPEGFEDKDRQPWRYRRRLSLLRKPLVQLDDGADPSFLIAPGLVHTAMVYTIDNYYRGDFPQGQLKTKMRSWRGKTTAQRGTAFNSEVAMRLQELGWQAASEVNMSAILGSAFKALGDIDVLAWNTQNGRVLLVECKDLKFSKTFGEIAEQLADFRGELRADGKPDDLLRHLRRVEAIAAHLTELSTFLRMSVALSPEGHLVFRNVVPMQFVWHRLHERVALRLFEELDSL